MSAIQQFAQQLEHASTAAQAKKILQHYLANYSIRSYAFTYYSGHTKSGRKLRFECVSTALQTWHEYYLQQKFADIDRTLEQSSKFNLPLFWDVRQQLSQAKNKRERRLRQESLEFRIDKGLSIPVYGAEGDFATLTLHQRKGENVLQNYLQDQFEWLSAAHVFYHYIKEILQLHTKNIQPYKLTPREQQCLTLTAKSWRLEQIARKLNITPRTVNFHLQNINRKLGTHNKYQACQKYFSNS